MGEEKIIDRAIEYSVEYSEIMDWKEIDRTSHEARKMKLNRSVLNDGI